MRSRVVFPEPEEPSRTRNSPSRIDKSTPSTAVRSPNCFLRFRISRPATALLPSSRPPVYPAAVRMVRRRSRGAGTNSRVTSVDGNATTVKARQDVCATLEIHGRHHRAAEPQPRIFWQGHDGHQGETDTGSAGTVAAGL